MVTIRGNTGLSDKTTLNTTSFKEKLGSSTLESQFGFQKHRTQNFNMLASTQAIMLSSTTANEDISKVEHTLTHMHTTREELDSSIHDNHEKKQSAG